MAVPNPTTTPNPTNPSATKWASVIRQVAAVLAIVVGGLQGVQAISGNVWGGAALTVIGGLIFYAEHNNNGNQNS
jgi:hypothetical protein